MGKLLKKVGKFLGKVGSVAGAIAGLPFGGQTARWRKAAQRVADASAAAGEFGRRTVDREFGGGGIWGPGGTPPWNPDAPLPQTDRGSRVDPTTGTTERRMVPGRGTSFAPTTGTTLPAVVEATSRAVPYVQMVGSALWNAYKTKYGESPAETAMKKGTELVTAAGTAVRDMVTGRGSQLPKPRPVDPKYTPRSSEDDPNNPGWDHLRRRLESGQTPQEYYGTAPDPEAPLADDSGAWEEVRNRNLPAVRGETAPAQSSRRTPKRRQRKKPSTDQQISQSDLLYNDRGYEMPRDAKLERWERQPGFIWEKEIHRPPDRRKRRMAPR